MAYALLARLVLTFSTANGNVTIFWIPGGLALAALLLWGKRFWPAVFIGALAAGLMVDDPFLASVFLALGNTLESLAALELLRRIPGFNIALTKTSDLLAIALVGAASAVISALIGPLTLLISDYLTPQTVFNHILHWWQADTLGILLGTPLLLVWRQWPDGWFSRQRMPYTCVFFLLAFLTGQVVFLGWFDDSVGPFARGYWMFLFVVWAAVQFGRHGVLFIIVMTAIQALLGATQDIGYFGMDLADTGLQNFWYYLLVLTATGMTLALVIKQRAQMFTVLQEKEQWLSDSQRLATIGSWLWHSDTGKITWSEETYRIYGVSPLNFDPIPDHLLPCLHPEDLLPIQQWLDDCLSLKHPVGIEFRIFRPDGEIRYLYGQGDVQPATQWQSYRAIGTVQDITQRKQAEEALKNSERMLKAIFESSEDGIAVADAETLRFVYFNQAICRMLGYSREELGRLTVGDIHDADDMPRITAEIEQLLRGKAGLIPELPFKRKDASIVFADNSAASLELAGKPHIMGIFRDVTERRQHEAQIHRLTQAYAALAETNRVARRADTENELFDAVCRIAVEHGGMKMAWIGMRQADGDLIQPVASHGAHIDYLDDIIISINPDAPEGCGPTGTAWRERRAVVLQDFATSPLTQPWQNRASQVGNWHASAALPILRCGLPYVVLTIYHDEENVFDELIISLLDAMVADIGFTLDVLDKDAASRIATQALRESEQRFRTLSDLIPDQIWTARPDGRVDYVNQRMLDFFGCTFDAMIEDNWQTTVHPEDLPNSLQRWSAALQFGQLYEMEFRVLHHSGEYRWCVARALPAFDEQGGIVKWYGINTDITERKHAENWLRLYAEMVNNMAEGLCLIRADDASIVYVNPSFEQMFAYAPDELLGKPVAILNAHQDKTPEAVALDIIDSLERTGNWRGEIANIHKNGTLFWCLAAVSTFDHAELGKVWVSIHQDITERKQRDEKLRLTAQVFESTQEGIIITDAQSTIVDVNAAFTHITGYTRQEVIGKNPRILKSGHQEATFYTAIWQAINNTGHWTGEMWNRHKDGAVYPVWATISAITNDKGVVTHYVGVSSDISLLKQHEKQLEFIAHYDALTGIPNRVLLVDRMQQALAQTRREQKLLAICYLDLDGFKPINDSYGHNAGDKVLIETAARIGGGLRGGDTVARLGGDEFVILLMGIDNADACKISLDRLLAGIGQAIIVDDHSFTVTASIGVTLYPLDNEDPDTLLRHADQAMYLAKQRGKNCYHIFDPHEDARIRINHEQRTRLEQGLRANEFELFYQPKVALENHRVVGAEALIRWRHPERGLLPPAKFLPLIENSVLEIQVGEWVIDTALAQMDYWNQQGLNLDVSINIDASHLQAAGFVEILQQKLAQYPDVQPRQLQIEILETAALADIATVTGIIDACVALGIRFALDDFGTGYSSLSYLRRLPADTLKIDQSFVRDMLVDQGDCAIVAGVIALAHTFKRTTVAEGVETPEHFQALREMGCHIGQGYGIARPMPADDVMLWCQTHHHE